VASGPSAEPMTPERVVGFSVVALTYLVAGVVGVGTWLWLKDAPILAVFVADLVATVVVFGASRITGNSSLYDPYWSVVPPLIAIAWWGDGVLIRQVLVAIGVFAWGLRLTWNWASGWSGLAHEDWRYVELRGRHPKTYWGVSFLGIHLFPTIQVFLGCLPLYPILTSTRPLDGADIAALIVLYLAVLLEGASDWQLRRFLRRADRKPYCDEGLWAWCRHPNYLGEMGFWWGLFLLGFAADHSWWWSGFGAVAITAMFVFISAPWLDTRNLSRRSGYASYMLQTYALIPWPPPR
jgi:steroid 5-alpha reductase family enzyme